MARCQYALVRTQFVTYSQWNSSFGGNHCAGSLAPLDLFAEADSLKEDLEALDTEDTVIVRSEVWVHIFTVAREQFRVPIRKMLGLKVSWDERTSFSRKEIRQIVNAACQKAEISEDEFWQIVERKVRLQYEETAAKCGHRRWEIERTRLLATLPDEATLAKIQRYEAHLSRQFYKELHGLQRLKMGLQSLHPSAALAIDVSPDTSGSEGVNSAQSV